MADFSDYIVNRNFNLLFELLSERQIIKGKSDLASKLGTYNHIINSVLKGERKLTIEQIQSLHHHYGVDPNFLLGYTDTIFIENQNGNQLANTGNIYMIPQKALAGHGLSVETFRSSDLQRFSFPGIEGVHIAIEISGDSMYPTLASGDIVICEKIDDILDIKENQLYVVVSDNVVAKRIQPIRGRGIVVAFRLISDNPLYQPYELHINELKAIYRIKRRVTNVGLY